MRIGTISGTAALLLGLAAPAFAASPAVQGDSGTVVLAQSATQPGHQSMPSGQASPTGKADGGDYVGNTPGAATKAQGGDFVGNTPGAATKADGGDYVGNTPGAATKAAGGDYVGNTPGAASNGSAVQK